MKNNPAAAIKNLKPISCICMSLAFSFETDLDLETRITSMPASISREDIEEHLEQLLGMDVYLGDSNVDSFIGEAMNLIFPPDVAPVQDVSYDNIDMEAALDPWHRHQLSTRARAATASALDSKTVDDYLAQRARIKAKQNAAVLSVEEIVAECKAEFTIGLHELFCMARYFQRCNRFPVGQVLGYNAVESRFLMAPDYMLQPYEKNLGDALTVFLEDKDLRSMGDGELMDFAKEWAEHWMVGIVMGGIKALDKHGNQPIETHSADLDYLKA